MYHPFVVAVKVWDVGGSAMQSRMLDKYVFGANAIMLIYDVTNSASFENLEQWLRTSQRVTSSMDKPPMYALVANKIDQEHLRTVKSDRHHKFAQVNIFLYFPSLGRLVISFFRATYLKRHCGSRLWLEKPF